MTIAVGAVLIALAICAMALHCRQIARTNPGVHIPMFRQGHLRPIKHRYAHQSVSNSLLCGGMIVISTHARHGLALAVGSAVVAGVLGYTVPTIYYNRARPST
jgi:hypothetical protein